MFATVICKTSIQRFESARRLHNQSTDRPAGVTGGSSFRRELVGSARPPLRGRIDETAQPRLRARYPDAWPASSPIRSSTFRVRASPWCPGLGCRSDFGRATRAKVTLISAPPGFGKTTLLADWLAASASDDLIPVWVSLDPSRQRVRRLLVRRRDSRSTGRCPPAGTAVSMVEGPQPPPIETVVTTLANELGSVGADIVMVLDDFHVIDASDVQDQVSFLLEHLPPSAHVVITTRADPPFPLARLRAQGQLVEVRAADLRFTRDEAAAYLNQAAGLDLEREPGRRAGGADGGLDRRAPAGRPLHAGPGRCRRLHRGFHWRRSLRRRLPRRGGPGAPTRGCAPVPSVDLHPRSADAVPCAMRSRDKRAVRPCLRSSIDGTSS